MIRSAAFSYICNQCGRCCRDQMITLSPYDVIRIAQAAEISTAEVVREYTIRRGSMLKFRTDGTCVALAGTRCSIHQGRPLACRLYPLGLERDTDGGESFTTLEPASGSLGAYGGDGTIADFVEGQGVTEYLAANEAYRRLLPLIRDRIAALVDFEVREPREFWRVATREALAETNFDPNPLINALFDADRLAGRRHSAVATVRAHSDALTELIRAETKPQILAAAGIMLAVSLGYPPGAWTVESRRGQI
ncbi:MAG: YkgJ family cysteine cluster protein [Candidatus Binataceae bacterium]